MGAASEAGQGVRLFRFGTESESVEKLATGAANAERAGYPHGVSVTTRVPTQTTASSAAREVVEQHFPVVRTGSTPGHHTVVLPKPITQEIADLFNRLFGRP